MEGQFVTTPFGRRAMSLGMLANQVRAQQIKPGYSIDKWKLYRSLCEAKPLLGVTDRALAVLNALLSFYPQNELSEETGLVVFPSNAQLSLRSHGMAEQTIRRHLAALVDAGLLTRKDSPNGKRYARKDRSGSIRDAFGFSLAPLLARAEEIEHLAAKVVAEKLYVQHLREQISLFRRDIAKLIEAAIADQVPGEWAQTFNEFRDIVESVPRAPTTTELEVVCDQIERLRLKVLNHLDLQIKLQNLSANPYQNERHIQNSNSESILDSEAPAQIENRQHADGHNVEQDREDADNAFPRRPVSVSIPSLPEPKMVGSDDKALTIMPKAGDNRGSELKSFPLGLVLQACPDIAAYGPGGGIRSWRDLTNAASVVKSMLGVTPSAYHDACTIMGYDNAATVIACILQRATKINSAGGYLRDLTRRTEKGEFAIGPMLMSLVRSNGGAAITLQS
ncbi:plasmid replication protein RepC [Rhizobium sp. 2MFCol3.1]|uniref:plasmid replication protein RepC n=1 Tax=Rhizobium sp. 2MFCol3.1 TaxID=1246459 RepID=UPI0004757A78|nr:plasmid replication protein RepC [Rhizobium sp. 2MFCol3.1]